jgi:hypothetical protein
MSKFLLVTVSAFLVAFIGVSATFDAKAADTMAPTQSRHQAASANRYCQDLWRCSPTAAAIGYHVCTRPCPDGYSCSALYGAYGPYGGVSYWGGYTDSGWSHYR